MEPGDLIRMQALLSYRVAKEGSLAPYPGQELREVPRFTVDRHAGGYLRGVRAGLPSSARERLFRLPEEIAFADSEAVFRILGHSSRRQVEVLYHVTDLPAADLAKGVSRQGEHFVVLEGENPVAWAWTMREHARAEQGTVETAVPYRRQGHGRAALAAWLRHVLERGKVPFVGHPEGDDAARKLLLSVGATELTRRVSYT